MRRVLGVAAIAGGALRVVDAFATAWPQVALLYLVTDVLLLAGATGLWLARRATLGLAGMIGLGVFAIGIVMVRVSAFGIGAYQTGATVALLGLAVYATETLVTRRGWLWAPLAWLAALAAGLAGSSVPAGVLFGIGFIAAGLEAVYGVPQSAQTATSTVT
jgi:hypothetical protein